MDPTASKILRKCISSSLLGWVTVGFFLGSLAPAEANRRHNVRPPAALTITPPPAPEETAEIAVAEPEIAETVAEPASDQPEATVPTRQRPAPKRGLFDILFSRGERQAKPAAGPGVLFDERMVEAARLAEQSARRRSINRCWRFVKRALKAAEVIACYPQTALAKHAATELPERYGFKELDVTDPHEAPVGAVLVYGGRGAGHVEIRTETGFVSDHASLKPSPRPLIGVFVKPVEG